MLLKTILFVTPSGCKKKSPKKKKRIIIVSYYAARFAFLSVLSRGASKWKPVVAIIKFTREQF